MRYSIRFSNYINFIYLLWKKETKNRKEKKKLFSIKHGGRFQVIKQDTFFDICRYETHIPHALVSIWKKGDEEWVISHRVQWSSNVFHCIMNMVASLNKLNLIGTESRVLLSHRSVMLHFFVHILQTSDRLPLTFIIKKHG